MRGRLICGILLLCATTSVQGAEQETRFTTKTGCVLQGRAYTRGTGADDSRYDIEIVSKPTGSHWNLTTDDYADDEFSEGVGGEISSKPYGAKKQTTIHATLHRYEILEERITFKNLAMQPIPRPAPGAIFINSPMRFLDLPKAITITTPSGITITLPAQTAATRFKEREVFNGNAEAVFIKIHTTPNQREALLPLSPLYKKYGKRVHIKLECPEPNLMVSYQANNTYNTIAIGLPNLKTITHLDALTLIVRQRVELQTVPVAFQVPVSRE